jgi:hypothetical protein
MARWALPAAQVPSDSSPDEWKVSSSTTRVEDRAYFGRLALTGRGRVARGAAGEARRADPQRSSPTAPQPPRRSGKRLDRSPWGPCDRIRGRVSREHADQRRGAMLVPLIAAVNSALNRSLLTLMISEDR